MALETILINDPSSEQWIQEIEQKLNQLTGVERVLIDTDDGEVKVEYDEEKITAKRIISAIQELTL